MKIRYDTKGSIVAVGDDSCDWQGRVLELAERDVPADLLATFALGRYVVRDGKLARVQLRPAAPVSLAALLGSEPPKLDPAVFAPGAALTAGGAGAPTAGPATARPPTRESAGKRTAKKARPGKATKAAAARLGRVERGKR